jgi:hypothetical protein
VHHCLGISLCFGNFAFLGGYTGLAGIPALGVFGHELKARAPVIYLGLRPGALTLIELLLIRASAGRSALRSARR